MDDTQDGWTIDTPPRSPGVADIVGETPPRQSDDEFPNEIPDSPPDSPSQTTGYRRSQSLELLQFVNKLPTIVSAATIFCAAASLSFLCFVAQSASPPDKSQGVTESASAPEQSPGLSHSLSIDQSLRVAESPSPHQSPTVTQALSLHPSLGVTQSSSADRSPKVTQSLSVHQSPPVTESVSAQKKSRGVTESDPPPDKSPGVCQSTSGHQSPGHQSKSLTESVSGHKSPANESIQNESGEETQCPSPFNSRPTYERIEDTQSPPLRPLPATPPSDTESDVSEIICRLGQLATPPTPSPLGRDQPPKVSPEDVIRVTKRLFESSPESTPERPITPIVIKPQLEIPAKSFYRRKKGLYNLNLSTPDGGTDIVKNVMVLEESTGEIRSAEGSQDSDVQFDTLFGSVVSHPSLQTTQPVKTEGYEYTEDFSEPVKTDNIDVKTEVTDSEEFSEHLQVQMSEQTESFSQPLQIDLSEEPEQFSGDENIETRGEDVTVMLATSSVPSSPARPTARSPHETPVWVSSCPAKMITPVRRRQDSLLSGSSQEWPSRIIEEDSPYFSPKPTPTTPQLTPEWQSPTTTSGNRQKELSTHLCSTPKPTPTTPLLSPEWKSPGTFLRTPQKVVLTPLSAFFDQNMPLVCRRGDERKKDGTAKKCRRRLEGVHLTSEAYVEQAKEKIAEKEKEKDEKEKRAEERIEKRKQKLRETIEKAKKQLEEHDKPNTEKKGKGKKSRKPKDKKEKTDEDKAKMEKKGKGKKGGKGKDKKEKTVQDKATAKKHKTKVLVINEKEKSPFFKTSIISKRKIKSDYPPAGE